MQKTDFKYTLIIADDCSKDKTPDIIREYAAKYPDIIQAVLRDKNIGPMKNFKSALSYCSSEYLALCEGDDYWIDENKLQKQIDYLDENSGCFVCFHPVKVIFQDNSEKESIFPDISVYNSNRNYTSDDLIKANFIQTNSVIYRWHKGAQDKMPDDILPGDYFLHMLIAKNGFIHCLDDVMSVYRRHLEGLWYESHKDIQGLITKYAMNLISFWSSLNKLYNGRYKRVIKDHLNETIEVLLKAYLNKTSDVFIGAIRKCPSNLNSFIVLRLNDDNIIIFKEKRLVYKKLKAFEQIIGFIKKIKNFIK